SKAPVIFVVSPQVSACPRLIVQFVRLLMEVSQMSLVHSIPSTQSAFVAQLRLTLWQVLKMLAPCWHCACTGGGPMTASATATAAAEAKATPVTSNFLALAMPGRLCGQRRNGLEPLRGTPLSCLEPSRSVHNAVKKKRNEEECPEKNTALGGPAGT